MILHQDAFNIGISVRFSTDDVRRKKKNNKTINRLPSEKSIDEPCTHQPVAVSAAQRSNEHDFLLFSCVSFFLFLSKLSAACTVQYCVYNM